MKLIKVMKRGLKKEKTMQSITRDRKMPPYCFRARTRAALVSVFCVMIENLSREP